MNQKSNIFIGGDSWGRGEWGNNKPGGYGVTHKGLEQFFIDRGYSVTNASVPGGSNQKSIQQLNLAISSYRKNDIVFWIQTDSLRDLEPFDTLNKDIISAGGLDILISNTVNQNYQNLDSIAKKLDTKIQCIGGKQDLDLIQLEKFTNLNPLVPSWVYKLAGHFNEYKDLFPHHTPTNSIIRYIDRNAMPTEIFYKTIDILYSFEQNFKIYNEGIFYPDGFHPNRNGHQILFDYIIKELNL